MNIDDLIKDLNTRTGKTDYDSIDELNAALRQLNERRNNAPNPEFDGLSATQIHRMLYFPFENVNDSVSFDAECVDAEVLASAPFVQRALTLLRVIHDAGKVKGTQSTGALPRKIVLELHERLGGRMDYPPRMEIDSNLVHIPRVVLQMAGWIKVQKKVFTVTVKGKKVVETGFSHNDYMHLLKTYARKYDWRYSTRFGDVEIVQLGFLFGLRLLMRQAKDFVPAEQLAKHFLKAFPPQQAVEHPALAHVYSPERMLTDAFEYLLVDGFAHGFGFAEVRSEKRKEKVLPVLLARSTKLADQLLTWHV